MNPKRQRKLVLIISLVLGIGVAIGLAMYAMRQNINLFYTPSLFHFFFDLSDRLSPKKVRKPSENRPPYPK